MFVEALSEWARSWAYAGAVVAFPLLMIFAALKDASSMTIPNWISATLIAVFALVGVPLLGLTEFGFHLLAGVVVLVACFAMFALNWIGGGDAKLIAAASLWLGWGAMGEFLFWTALVGGGLSLALLAARKLGQASTVALGQGAWSRLATARGDIPYGIAIAAGGLAAFPKSGLF